LNESFLNHVGCPVLHTGVEVLGREYTFAGGSGVFEGPVKSAPPAVYRTSILLGNYTGGQQKLLSLLDSLRGDFPPDGYNVLSRNCNSFSDAFCRELFGHGVPPWVNRAAWIGSWFECCFTPEQLGGGGQEGGGGGEGDGGGGGGLPFLPPPGG